MFITFEGLDYCGKTTQANLLADALRREGRTVLFLREPGGTRISERVREILLDAAHGEMAAVTELLLFSASRAQLVHEVIRPALARGEIVVCDRYVDSTTAYQGSGRALDPAAVRAVSRIATGGLEPDLTLFLDIEVDEILRRRDPKGPSPDRMETSGREFYERVREAFRGLARTEGARFVTIDGMAPPAEVAAAIRAAVARARKTSVTRERTS